MSTPKAGSQAPSPSRRSRLIGIIAAVVAVLFFVVPILVGIYTDFAWFRSVDYQGVYYHVYLVRGAMFLIFGLVAALSSPLCSS